MTLTTDNNGLIQSGALKAAARGGVQTVTVLGATGSIGTNTLDIIARHPECFAVEALTAQSSVDDLALLARRHHAKLAVIGDDSKLSELKALLAGSGTEAAAGEQAVIEAASRPADCVMAAIVGAAGLKPTFAAAAQGRRVALANKECLVCAGDLFTGAVAAAGGELLPVDSEHSGVFQCLAGNRDAAIEKIVLTASGGPFRDWPAEKLREATVKEALCHPNWSMGSKVTIDSATLMNKGLELIEAFHLFPVNAERLDAVVHPQSIVHCLVTFADGSMMAQMASPDMRTPIAYALAWPERIEAPTKRLDLAEVAKLTFEAVDETRFPAIALARECLRRGGSLPCALNAANEVAVSAFLNGRIAFLAIADVVRRTLEASEARGLGRCLGSLEDVLDVDDAVRRLAVEELAAQG